RDRDEAAVVGDEVDHPSGDRPDERPLPGERHLLLVRAAQVPGRPDERLLELVPEEADPLLPGEDVVAGAADVEDRAGRDPERLPGLPLVRVEADVLL